MKKILIYIGVIVAFFIIGVIVANFIIMPIIVHRGKEIKVPNVCNMPLDDAMKVLKNNRLEGLVAERRYDQIIEQGYIIIQEPLPDEKVKSGRIIHLTVSLGPQVIKIPFLTGVDIEKGELILKRLGFKIEKIDYVNSDTIPRKEIIRTIPEPEVELTIGDPVQIIVSKGPVLKMPDLTGKVQEEYESILDKMDLVLGEIKEVEGSGVKGSVIVQSPAPEEVIEPGDTVTLMVIR
jgi:beta-lactam-binding protein with PASTA domain